MQEVVVDHDSSTEAKCDHDHEQITSTSVGIVELENWGNSLEQSLTNTNLPRLEIRNRIRNRIRNPTRVHPNYECLLAVVRLSRNLTLILLKGTADLSITPLGRLEVWMDDGMGLYRNKLILLSIYN